MGVRPAPRDRDDRGGVSVTVEAGTPAVLVLVTAASAVRDGAVAP